MQTIWNIFTNNYPLFLRGAQVTLIISVIGTLIGTGIGLIIGIFRTYPTNHKDIKTTLIKIVNGLFTVYIEVFRGTPMIVQAMIFYYGLPILFNINVDPFTSAIVIVSVNTGAYMSEVVRGGIISIDKGQFEASDAIGMTHIQRMRYIILPQVIRNILPATGNEFVINIKDTSVLSVIQVSELFFQTRSVAGANFMFFQTFIITAIIYFIMTFTITRILLLLEKKLDGPADFVMAGNQMQVKTPKIRS